MGDVDPTGDRVWRSDAEQLRADLERERFARRAIDQALLDAITERDSLRAALAEAMTAGQSMEGQCNDLEAERDRLRDVLRETFFWLGPVEFPSHGDYGVVIPATAKAVTDERDRLRAVVEAVRHFIALQVTDDHPPEDDAAAWDRMVASLEQLDVSPNTGGDPDD